MPTETYLRKKAIPKRLNLTADELDWFTGTPYEPGKTWWRDCQRTELNEFTSPELVEFIEQRLAEVGATAKLLPPDDVLAEQAKDSHRRQIESLVAELVARSACRMRSPRYW